MRTSTKIFFGSLGLLGVGLLVYDLQLNAAFRTGDYTRPFYNYEQQQFKGFDQIRLNSATALNILLVQGEYKVLVNPRLHDVVQVTQDGGQLVITAHFPYRLQGPGGDYALYVSCPDLREFSTSEAYYMRNKLVNDQFLANPWSQPTVISGFRVDSVRVFQEDGGNLVLENDQIGVLHATVGTGCSLTLRAGNMFSSGDISVRDHGELNLKDTRNLTITQHLADSATLILNGAAARRLLKN